MAVDEETRNLIVSKWDKGIGKRKISREVGVSRNTVRRVLNAVATQRRRGHSALPNSPVRRGSKLDEYEEYIKETLEKYPDLTAVRMHEKLQQKGFDGQYTIVKECLRQVRPRPKKTPVTRYETAPGKQGQQDWSPYDIPFIDDGLQTVKAFSLVLGYSRRQHLRFCENEQFITLIREHRAGFERLEGVPAEILYDRQKAVVLGWEAGRNLYNPRFLAFATHYGFRPRALPPRKPEWKGKVERPFDYVDKNLLGGRRFRNIDHLNEVTDWWEDNRADVRIHGTLKERPIDRFVVEAPRLLPLPARPYDTAEVGYRVVSIEGMVSWDVTPYSVPCEHVLEIVAVRATEQEIFVYDAELNELARHERAPRGQIEPVAEPSHRPKKKSRHDIDLLVVRMGELGDIAAQFAAGILERQRYRGSHLAQVLGLVERYSADDLVAALERAVRYRAFDGKVVQRILEASAVPRRLPEDAERAARERLSTMLTPTKPRSLNHYAVALRGGGQEERS